MSLRHEQYAALRKTREFLGWLLTEKGRLTKGELRKRASACLRHWPVLKASGEPVFSEDDFGDGNKGSPK